MTRPLRVGVIGVGALGRHHARHLAQLEGARLVGVTDIDSGRARAVAEELDTEACALDRLLGRVEAVTIAVPTPAHVEVGLRALERGIPVLMEKPLAVTLEEADRLIAAAAAKGVQLQVGHIERYNRAIRAAEPYLDGPRYIESLRLAPFQPRGTDVAVVLDLMIHDLDLVLHLTGGAEATEVRASGLSVLSSHLDLASGAGEFMRVRGDWQPGTGQALSDVVERIELAAPEADALRLELRSFVHAVQGEREVVVSGEEGRAALALALRVADAVRQSPLAVPAPG